MNMLGIAMRHVSFGMVSSMNLFRTFAVAPKADVAIMLIPVSYTHLTLPTICSV